MWPFKKKKKEIDPFPNMVCLKCSKPVESKREFKVMSLIINGKPYYKYLLTITCHGETNYIWYPSRERFFAAIKDIRIDIKSKIKFDMFIEN